MIKLLTEYLGYDAFAELALVMFAIIFVTIVIRTLMMHSDTTREQSKIVLDDNHEQSNGTMEKYS